MSYGNQYGIKVEELNYNEFRMFNVNLDTGIVGVAYIKYFHQSIIRANCSASGGWHTHEDHDRRHDFVYNNGTDTGTPCTKFPVGKTKGTYIIPIGRMGIKYYRSFPCRVIPIMPIVYIQKLYT